MKRFLSLAMYVMLLAAVLAPAQSAGAQDGGNADAAHACQQGGYRDLARSDGSGFANTGECVSYAAQGGVLTNLSGGGGDEGGGSEGECADYENLAPSTNPSLPFQSQEDCQAFVDGEGTAVPYDSAAPQVSLFNLGDGFQNLCAVGVGLKRFPANSGVSVSITHGGERVAGSPFPLTTDDDGATDPLVVLVSVTPGTYTASASTGSQTYSDTVYISC